MPKESPPGPDFDLKEIEAIAREAPRRLPGLAPLGGPRWTREDIDLAVSFLYQETEGKAYQRAAAGGMTRVQKRRWLLTALRNRLLKLKAAFRRIDLLDDLALDRFSDPSDGRDCLLHLDKVAMVDRIVAQLSTEERATASHFLGGDGLQGALTRVSARTRKRHRARLRQVVGTVVLQAELTRGEAREILAALAVKLTGGGAFLKRKPRIRGPFESPRGLVVTGAPREALGQ